MPEGLYYAKDSRGVIRDIVKSGHYSNKDDEYNIKWMPLTIFCILYLSKLG
jgi:hypothetical protein